jgi:hypothetical protein
MSAAEQKQHAHELVDRLDTGQLNAVIRLLEVMTDPVARSLANAPIDDEPVTEEEARDITAARAAFERGDGIPHEQVLAEFGLSLQDFAPTGRPPVKPSKTRR